MDESEKATGVMMIVAAAAVVFAMAHHPTGPDAGVMAEIVHGTMIVLLVVLLTGFIRFSQLRGLKRVVILLGLVSFGLSFIANVGAATINGFVVGALANADAAVSHEILLLCWEANQALARLGVASTGAALVFWSCDLLRQSDGGNRMAGVLGMVAGLAPLAWFFAVSPEMNVHVALVIYVAHALWMGLIGVQLFRGRICPDP